jgi:FixJ family two-component response regulator
VLLCRSITNTATPCSQGISILKLQTIHEINSQRRRNCGSVFVFEDDDSLRQSLEALLLSEGYYVACAPSPDESKEYAALHDIQINTPAVILCDVVLQFSSGLRVLTERPADIPVIMMSGNSTELEVVRAYDQGAYRFLLKPLDVNDLLHTVKNALSTHRELIGLRIEHREVAKRFSKLTPRELDVIKLVSRGCRNAEICDLLEIALRTVKLHKQHALEKLDYPTLPTLIYWTNMLEPRPKA